MKKCPRCFEGILFLPVRVNDKNIYLRSFSLCFSVHSKKELNSGIEEIKSDTRTLLLNKFSLHHLELEYIKLDLLAQIKPLFSLHYFK